MLSTLDVPFDVWHSILRDVYVDFEAFPSLDDPQYVLSPLHKRLLIHRNLSLVSKHLHELSSSVFLESLELHNPESLLAVSQLLTKDPNLARVVRKLSFNFYDYRCGVSMPRRGRELKEFIQEDSSSGYVDPVGQAIARRRLAMEVAIRTKWETYAPSGTRQPNHWVGWTGFVRTILSLCTGVSHVEIDAVADYTQHAQRRNARNYRSLFGSPDLNSTGILTGLLEAKNLHTLKLVDPSPLDDFGSALGKWPMLREVDIEVSEGYPEARRLSEAIFTPPRYLERFALVNRSKYVASLPSISDLTQCRSLSSLELGVLNLADTATILAAQYLISAYQHSLVELTLHVRKRGMIRDITPLMKYGDLSFPLLKKFVARHGTCQASVFTAMQADRLEEIELRALDVDLFATFPSPTSSTRRSSQPHNNSQNPSSSSTAEDPTGANTTPNPISLTQEYRFWTHFLAQPSLSHLKSFRVAIIHTTTGFNPHPNPHPNPNHNNPNDVNPLSGFGAIRDALNAVASERGIDVDVDPTDIGPELGHLGALGIGPGAVGLGPGAVGLGGGGGPFGAAPAPNMPGFNMGGLGAPAQMWQNVQMLQPGQQGQLQQQQLAQVQGAGGADINGAPALIMDDLDEEELDEFDVGDGEDDE